jgi:hypothetical protein
MEDKGFDITELFRFNPPQYRCRKCLALVTWRELTAQKGVDACPICKVEYLPTKDFGTLADYLKWEGLEIKFQDPIEHAKKLALLARRFRQPNNAYPPIRVLAEMISSAQLFVHIVSYGIDAQMIGMLKQASNRIKVNGVISNVSNSLIQELTEFPSEAPNCQLRPYLDGTPGWTGPHQKLVVIDGLIGFVGSANFTTNSWRKSASGKDYIEVVTDITKVKQLNNKLFSPIWSHMEGEYQGIEMEVDLPF